MALSNCDFLCEMIDLPLKFYVILMKSQFFFLASKYKEPSDFISNFMKDAFALFLKAQVTFSGSILN